jgi:Flp pilus assembly protein TadG
MQTPISLTRRPRQRGAAIVIFSLLAVTVILPMVGLAIDGGILYILQAKLSQACDAAALAGGRNLNNGNNTAAQTANAEATMAAFFNANFPSGTWNTQPPQVTFNVQSTGLHTRTTTIDVTVQAPLYFMRVIGINYGTVGAHGQASRKDVNLMLVLDRSSSMAAAGVCSQMVTQARTFVSQFTNGRDQVGLITFMGGSNLDYAPTVSFKTQTPSLDDTLSTLVCGGNTGSAQALWLAYQQLLTMAVTRPGALNVIVFFTDGQPNGLTFDFVGLNPNSILPMKTLSDSRLGTGTSGSPYSDSAAYYTMPGSLCTGLLSPMGVIAQWGNNATTGPTAGVMSSSSGSISSTNSPAVGGALGCYFSSDVRDVRRDIAYIPSQDHWGNSTTGYKGGETVPSGPYVGMYRIDTPTSISAASTNAADDAGRRIRNDLTLKPIIFTVGLGGTDPQPIDQDFLERIANDPRSSSYSTLQPAGQFAYASDINQLGSAFQAVASTILRLSQ